MKKVYQIFLKGLILVLPISLTFYLLSWAGVKAESVFGSLYLSALGERFYYPGIGIIITLLFVFLVGLLAHGYLSGRVLQWFSRKMEKFPLIKVIYNPLKDLMALLPGGDDGNEHQRVVLVDWNGAKVMGLVTREGLTEIKHPNLLSVYVPFSYMLGGMTILVRTDQVEKVDIPVDQAIKLSVTAWIKASETSE